jgi:hypothetical protein
MRTLCACTVAVGVVIAGCGGASAGAPLAPQDSATLGRDIGAIRTAAAADDRTGAQSAVARLRADVERMRGAGRLSPADSQTILLGVDRVDGRIAAEVHPPVSATTPPSPPAAAPAAKPAPPGPVHPKRHGHDHGPHGGSDAGD